LVCVIDDVSFYIYVHKSIAISSWLLLTIPTEETCGDCNFCDEYILLHILLE
jgi:hypothetical protein